MSRNILITGASGNLGAVVVKKFLDEGYKVIAVGNPSASLEFALSNPQFEITPLDITDEQATIGFIKELIRRHNKIDAALLLAGGFSSGSLDKTDGAALKKMYATNFETAYYIVHELFPHFIANDYGRIIMVGARPALKPEQGKNLVAYALSKSLIFKLAELLNEAAKGKDVTATVFVPSTIDTAPNRESMPDANFNNWVKPEQIADLMEMVCSGRGASLRETVLKVYNNS